MRDVFASKRVPAPRPSAVRWITRALVGLLCVFGGSACGGTGTGSSGLISPERALVARVLETRTCEAFEGVDYCPSDTPDALPSGQFIQTPFDESSSVACFRTESSVARCLFVFSFSPQGFEEGGQFVLGLRGAESDEPWDLFSLNEPLEEGDEDFDLIVTSVVVDLEDETGEEVQMAILSFPTARTDLPEQTPTLAALGAETVFVAPPVEAITEVADEDASIAEARSGDQCVESGVIALCPTGEQFDEGELQPALGPPPFPSPTRVDVSIDELSCAAGTTDGACTVTLDFDVLGDVGFYYRPAIRLAGAADERWQLGAEVEDMDEIDLDLPRSFQTTVDLPLRAFATASVRQVDVVILVDPLDPLDLPESVASLNETVPVYAFVAPVAEVARQP